MSREAAPRRRRAPLLLALAALASARPAVDLRPFERDVLPRWLDRFTIDWNKGVFRYEPNATAPSLYGLIDVVHVLASTGLIDTVDDDLRDAWALTLAGFQSPSGFYDDGTNNTPGWQPWHGAASATAALALLQRRPRRPVVYCEALARRGLEAWKAECVRARIFRRRVAATPRPGTWTFRGDKSLRRRGCDVDIPWRRVMATPAAWDVAIPWSQVAAPPQPRT